MAIYAKQPKIKAPATPKAAPVSGFSQANPGMPGAHAGGPGVPVAQPAPIYQPGQYDPARFQGFADYLRGEREGDMARGAEFANGRFGESNPAMKAILDARKAAAFGTDEMTDLMRARGVQGINSQFATGMRSLKGLQGASGLSGGAALGQALPQLAKANLARGNLETDLAANALQRRDSALGAYESSLTGERAGELGTMFGYAGLGAGDRSSAMQYRLGQDYINSLPGYGPNIGGGGGQGYVNPWNNFKDRLNPTDAIQPFFTVPAKGVSTALDYRNAKWKI